jgi:hypothetical protein
MAPDAPLGRTVQIGFRVSPEVHDAIERARGLLNRTEWLNQLVARELARSNRNQVNDILHSGTGKPPCRDAQA